MGSRGFTLLELLVALVVLAVALGALIKAGSEHARNTAYLQERALAEWVAANVLADYEAGLLPAEPGTRRTSETLAGREWEARVEIENRQFDAPLELPPVRRIEIRVWPTGGDPDHPLGRETGYALP
ncbi:MULTISPECIES: type II secretion system minor pseudopilin GspI [Thioalkalivibrio]|uniref:Type II secretion system protein I n=1 Tax=Thioalkalivibrio halophilus TaxID=252474 RepID=A0A1V2ZVH3_9GAMM|nr:MULTISPECIES: type II secretion system minor pseudopilin GspI [Thioalkalivibrio]OOC09128.1 type II secretion system protein GspI [Thioalkalivibrio halophilus]PYG04217.1 general secretion pathway protein I [Thioalkalivibrio sp. ALE21]